MIANFALAQTWDWFAKPVQGLMEDTHMSFGVLLAAVIVARLVWRLIPGHQLSSLEAGWVRIASKGTHYLLYTLAGSLKPASASLSAGARDGRWNSSGSESRR